MANVTTPAPPASSSLPVRRASSRTYPETPAQADIIRRAFHSRGLWLGPLAWLLALWAQSLLPAEPGRTWAVWLLVLAGVLAVTAWGGTRLIPALPTTDQRPPTTDRNYDRQIRVSRFAFPLSTLCLVGFALGGL